MMLRQTTMKPMYVDILIDIGDCVLVNYDEAQYPAEVTMMGCIGDIKLPNVFHLQPASARSGQKPS